MPPPMWLRNASNFIGSVFGIFTITSAPSASAAMMSSASAQCSTTSAG